jgi:hypothetical protein
MAPVRQKEGFPDHTYSIFVQVRDLPPDTEDKNGRLTNAHARPCRGGGRTSLPGSMRTRPWRPTPRASFGRCQDGRHGSTQAPLEIALRSRFPAWPEAPSIPLSAPLPLRLACLADIMRIPSISVLFAHGMGRRQHQDTLDNSSRQPSLFAIFDTVSLYVSIRVGKDASRRLKAHAELSEVPGRFGGVPFKARFQTFVFLHFRSFVLPPSALRCSAKCRR